MSSDSQNGSGSRPHGTGKSSRVRSHLSVQMRAGHKAPWIAITALGLALVAGAVALDSALARRIKERVGEVLVLLNR